LNVDRELLFGQLDKTLPGQFIISLEGLIGIADRGQPDRPPLGPDKLFFEEFRRIDLDVDKSAPRLAVPGIPPHEEPRIAITAVDLASGIGIHAIVKNLGFIKDALGLDLSYTNHDYLISFLFFGYFSTVFSSPRFRGDKFILKITSKGD
jgi:hypothetical protein